MMRRGLFAKLHSSPFPFVFWKAKQTRDTWGANTQPPEADGCSSHRTSRPPAVVESRLAGLERSYVRHPGGLSHATGPRAGCGSKLNHHGPTGFQPFFHVPGFHFGYIFLTHSHLPMPSTHQVIRIHFFKLLGGPFLFPNGVY